MTDDDKTHRLERDETVETEHYAPSGAREQIGSYSLLEKLGEGGMGEVWLAEQQEPVRRKVALKIIKQGMDTKQVIARFEAERQALALMDHPAIAKVYDAGATPRGRPFFVMEHVKGVSVTDHADTHRLTTRERLDLFCQICEGVQHAHQKAILHRDLKPSNLLVSHQDGKAQVKIIDFGLAKATAQRLTEKTLHTQLGVLMGTPDYMSPEQAEMTGQDVDTRTDVYSLGVILYELLTGALPFEPKELREGGFDAIRRKIREEEPSRPSTRVKSLEEKRATTSARKRRTERGKLVRRLKGDLDWIVIRCLEKDRSRRFGSPHELAADIERYLTDQPVLASPPSAAYRTKKFVRRHTWGVAAAAVGVVTLVAFAATMAIQAKRIATERDLAQQAQAQLESVVVFQAGMLSATDPESMGRRLMKNLSERVAEAHRGGGSSEEQVATSLASLDTLVGGVNSTDLAADMLDEDILAAAVQELEEEFQDQPVIDSRLRETIGDTYRQLGRYERAEPQLLRALETRKRVLGNETPDTLESQYKLANLYETQHRYADAESLLVTTLESRKRVLGNDHPDTLLTMNRLAVVYLKKARYAEAEPLLLATLEISKRVLEDDDPSTLNSMNSLAGMYFYQDRVDEAEPLLLAVLEGRKRVLGNDHPHTLESVGNLGSLRRKQGKYAEAAALFGQALEARRRVLGDEHPQVGSTHWELGFVSASLGERAETLAHFRRAVDMGWAEHTILTDASLDSLRGDPEFEAVVAMVEELLGEK